MIEKAVGSEWELPEGQLIAISASELLLHPTEVIRLWPEVVSKNPSLLHQVEVHSQNIAALKEVTTAIESPTQSLQSALEAELVNTAQLTNLYESLSTSLKDKDTRRLVLYLPFQFLPSSSWKSRDEQLQIAVDSFRESYVSAWESQLSVHDVRANFVDGDVIETSQRVGDLPRVVKAAHLIPELLEHGLIDRQRVQDIYDSTGDDVLRESIAEALSYDEDSAASRNPQAAESSLFAPTERRKQWLEQKETTQHLGYLGKELGQYILDSYTESETAPDIALIGASETAKYISIEAIQSSVEQAAREGSIDPNKLFNYFKHEVIQQWLTEDAPAMKDKTAQLIRRMYRLGIMSKDELNILRTPLPVLSGSLTKNLEASPESTQKIEQLLTSLTSDDELTEMIYPVVSVGGSRLKGYGVDSSDLDIGIFVRPNTNASQASKLRDRLQLHFDAAHLDDEPVEFWLEDSDSDLLIKTVDDLDRVTADKYWTHVLFNSAMAGDSSEINTLRKKLLRPYFADLNAASVGPSDRSLYLERIEQDLLQYRLMHKGYERHYPRVSPVRSASVDGHSMFWDAGYRRLATELFIEKVFLPKIF